MTTQLHFQLPDHLAIEDADRIPVEVTDEAFMPRAVLRLGQAVTLEGGVYGATATLPDGRKLSGAVRIEEGAQTAVVALREVFAISVSSDAAGPTTSRTTATSSARAAAAAAEGEAELGDAPATRVVRAVEDDRLAPEVPTSFSLPLAASEDDAALATPFSGKLALLKGNPWDADAGPEPEVPEEWWSVDASPAQPASESLLSLPVHGFSKAQSLLFLRPDRRAIVVALPLEPWSHCHVQLRQTFKDGIFPHISFCDHDVDLLLRYAGAGLLGEARRVADVPSVLARDFIEEKEEHPLGAALGFYLLLRLGDESLSIDWTERLMQSAPWLPDGLIIHAELQARRGDHEKAAQVLANLPQRGLPFFTSGLSYAVERLRQYESWVKKGHLKGIDGVPEIYEALRQVSLCSDPTRPILTYQVGQRVDREAYELAVGRAVEIAKIPPARSSRSVEFHAPIFDPDSDPATPLNGIIWSRALRLRSRPADAASDTDADTSERTIGEPF